MNLSLAIEIILYPSLAMPLIFIGMPLAINTIIVSGTNIISPTIAATISTILLVGVLQIR